MNVDIRARRTLRKLEGYDVASECSELPDHSLKRLGRCTGCYKNPLPDGRVVWVCESGISWGSGS